MKHTPTPNTDGTAYKVWIDTIKGEPERVEVVDADFARDQERTIEALEKSHAELLAALDSIRDSEDRTDRSIAEAAIANAQPVVTMLSNQGGTQK